MSRYHPAELAHMARTVEHAKYRDPNRYCALVEAVHRRSGVKREHVMEKIRQLTLL